MATCSNSNTKVARQHETTWTQLHKRTSSVPFDFGALFPQDIATFLHHKATSLNGCIGYFTPALLATTAYLSAKNGCAVETVTHEQPMNLYMMFVGYPGTVKSSAIEHGCLKLLAHVFNEERSGFVLDRTTSAGLVKHLATNENGFLVSPEIYDVLIKLLKNDDENASGDAMLLCKLFSGEPTTYQYSTENSRETPANTPFSVLDCTQMPNVAKLIARMDQGQGLVDRFLIAVPFALCPTSAEVQTAKYFLTTEPEDTLSKCFSISTSRSRTKSHHDAKQLLKSKKDEFVAEVNDAIQDGCFVPPKSKLLDLMPRVAASLHVFSTAMSNFLAGHADTPIPAVIPLEILQRALSYVNHLESQKHTLCQFIKSVTQNVFDAPRPQPTTADVKTAILLLPGPVSTYRAFRQSAPRFVRGSTKQEYDDAITQLKPHLGSVVSVLVARSSRATDAFVKKQPESFAAVWPYVHLCEKAKYAEKYDQPVHKAITKNIKDFLLKQEFLSREQYDAQ